MLTNFATVSGRVKRMQELRAMQAAGDFDGMPKREALPHTRELESSAATWAASPTSTGFRTPCS